jgi:hypothetical protein
MIKGIHQCIPAVVTGQAVIAKQAGMVGREIRLAGRVTLNAVNQIGHQTLLQMAVMTGHLRFVKIFLMAGQTKICQLVMLKVVQAQESDIGFSPLMFRMAVFTAGSIMQTAVQPFSIGPLSSNFHMTAFTSLCGYALPGCMALAALSFKFGMAGKIV